MTKKEVKDYISRMNVDQLRENLLETTLLVHEMKDQLDLKVAELLIEKEKRKIEKQKLKDAIQEELNKQNRNLN